MGKDTGRKRKKGSFGFVLLYILILLLFIISALLLWTSISGNKTGESPNWFNWSVYSVKSEDDTILKGQAVLTSRDVSQLEVGDAVVYSDGRQMNLAYFDEMDENNCFLYTKNDSEMIVVKTSDVRGKAVKAIAVLGSVIAFAQGVYGPYVFAAATLIFLILLIILPIARHKKYANMDNDGLLFVDDKTSLAEEDEDFRDSLNIEEKAQDDYSYYDDGGVDIPSNDYFGLKIDSAYSQKEEDNPASIFGELRDKEVHLVLEGAESEIEAVSHILDRAIEKHGSGTATFDIYYGEKTKLDIYCTWSDMEILSPLMSEIQKHLQGK